MIWQEVDGLGLGLKAFHDLSFLKGFGRVFCVFDQLISGNLCFGVKDGERRLFIKYAGAHTLHHAGQPGPVIERLKGAQSIYQELAHPQLSRLLGSFDTPGGFGLVFEWFDGYALAPVSSHREGLRRLPLLQRLKLYDGLCDFLAHACARDYICAGISDLHIMMDFEQDRAAFCSVDQFAKMPLPCPHPKLAGSPFYLPPEAYLPGFPLDERCNVYIMGALAFTFFGDVSQRTAPAWDAGQALFAIASQACEENIARRPPACGDYLSAWRSTVLKMSGF